MSAAARALATLMAGERPAEEGLLHTARLEGWGSLAYGEEAVLAAVRRAPAGESNWDVVGSANVVAMFGDDLALFADVTEGRLRRVWRLGPGPCLPRESAVFVAFDPDMNQARGDVFGDPDNPDHEAIAVAGTMILREVGGFRIRAFPIRTIRSGDDLAILFAIYRLGDGPARSCGFSYAAARLRLQDGAIVSSRIVRDAAGEAAVAEQPMLPRI
jgi:hypothetical protein